MRFVVMGAGAVGGVVGGRLAEHGHAVMLIARGAHYDALRREGLSIVSPAGARRVRVPVVEHPRDIEWTADEVILLAVKTQDTATALQTLQASAPPDVPLVCLQNGVVNEREALRRFPRVYGVCVMCPTGYLTPGVVQAWSTPTTGLLDIGRYPDGVDATAERVAAALRTATFGAETRVDIMRWKYGKLLLNLGNAVQAICGTGAHGAALTAAARREGVACLQAARIDFVGKDEDAVRRGTHLQLGQIAGHTRDGGSSWQSLQRQVRSIETDYLNGEIVVLGRLHGAPTPVNELLARLANRLAQDAVQPGSMSPAEVIALLPPDVRPPL